MWKPTISSDELYHHGILGMSWGKRNGPPYPLDSEDHSAAEKKAGYKKSLGDGSTSSVKKNSDSQRIAKANYKMYKAYNRSERRRKVTRDSSIGGAAGALIGFAGSGGNPFGALAFLVAGAASTAITSAAVRTGKDIINNRKYKKALQEKYGEAIKKNSMASKKETKALLKKSKNPYYQKDVREFGKMSKEDFEKEMNNRKKAYDAAEKELKEPSKSKGESIAKKEAAETAFNRYVTMAAYKREIEKMRKD